MRRMGAGPGEEPGCLAFPDDFAFSRNWVVFEDVHFIVINKPSGLPTIDAEPESQVALVPKLFTHLGRSEHLPVLSRLDREASGLIAFPISREALLAMEAAQRDGRLRKRYVAGVRWPSHPPKEGWLRDRIEYHKGQARISESGKEALSKFKCLRSRGSKALVELELVTGRTHQIRLQLAHRGAPIAGDRLYGGDLAPRLLLCCIGITLPHPERGELDIEIAIPSCFEKWFDETLHQKEGFALSWESALRYREEFFERGKRGATTAFRLFNEEGDGYPGVAVDLYGEHLVLHLREQPLEEKELIDVLSSVQPKGIYVKRHPKSGSKFELEHVAPCNPIWGDPAPSPLVIRENGIPFFVHLDQGLATGIYLDQRENRRRLREGAENQRLLNLFAYRCGFTVAAAVGGARETLSVDLSRQALDWGEANLERAAREHPHIRKGKHRFVCGDVFEVLSKLKKEKELFDWICVDPPTFSRGPSGHWTSGKAWVDLFAEVLGLLDEGGRVLATSNDRRMAQATFRRFAQEGAKRAQRAIARMKDLEPPRDFRAFPAHAHAQKGLLIECE
ncbi:MAG: class I SAM-dependent methyltransferase [Sandaracinaceae bacterium]|nr:class I SAM-dependent methyltransferase [Sandaracinaceae bacterium]